MTDVQALKAAHQPSLNGRLQEEDPRTLVGCAGELIQIPRIIVIDGTPGKVPEVSRRFFSSNCWTVDSIELGQRLGWGIRKKPSFKHRPPGDAS